MNVRRVLMAACFLLASEVDAQVNGHVAIGIGLAVENQPASWSGGLAIGTPDQPFGSGLAIGFGNTPATLAFPGWDANPHLDWPFYLCWTVGWHGPVFHCAWELQPQLYMLPGWLSWHDPWNHPIRTWRRPLGWFGWPSLYREHRHWYRIAWGWQDHRYAGWHRDFYVYGSTGRQYTRVNRRAVSPRGYRQGGRIIRQSPLFGPRYKEDPRAYVTDNGPQRPTSRLAQPRSPRLDVGTTVRDRGRNTGRRAKPRNTGPQHRPTTATGRVQSVPGSGTRVRGSRPQVAPARILPSREARPKRDRSQVMQRAGTGPARRGSTVTKTRVAPDKRVPATRPSTRRRPTPGARPAPGRPAEPKVRSAPPKSKPAVSRRPPSRRPPTPVQSRRPKRRPPNNP